MMKYITCVIASCIAGFSISGIHDLERVYKKTHSDSVLVTLYSAWISFALCVALIIVSIVME